MRCGKHHLLNPARLVSARYKGALKSCLLRDAVLTLPGKYEAIGILYIDNAADATSQPQVIIECNFLQVAYL